MIPEWGTEWLVNSSSEKNLEITEDHELNMSVQFMLKQRMEMSHLKTQIKIQLVGKAILPFYSSLVWTQILKLNPALGVAGKIDMATVQRKTVWMASSLENMRKYWKRCDVSAIR